MQSAIIIDFAAYQNSQGTLPESPEQNTSACSEELGVAIQMLIKELRKNIPCCG